MSSTSKDTKDFFGRLVGTTGRAMKRRLDHNLVQAGSDLSADYMMLLGFLSEHEGVNQQEVTDHMFRDKTATTRWLDALEARNLVARVPDKADRRQKLIFLTKQGRQTVGELVEIVHKTEREALQGIDSQNVKTCRKVLRLVRANLEG
ncbi:MAG TPA: MarR family transcriptional regulator [Acidobacteriota bacterium]|nr:MarR family transcriptional regulator [Acidobacteriota bacterium]